MQRHRNYYDRGVSGSNRVYVLLLILIGILTAAFFIGGTVGQMVILMNMETK